MNRAVLLCSLLPLISACDPEPGPCCNTPDPDAGTPPATVHMSYLIVNHAAISRVCEVIVMTPANPEQATQRFEHALEPGQGASGYHVRSGPPPFYVSYLVGCWERHDTPLTERVYYGDSVMLTNSAAAIFRNTTDGVVFEGTESTP